ncbi:MAG TPA: Lrp/AsnC family transcriptional regulator, partial [Dehalococcoidia bacterium]|nr:Lrp/AsnC family transcriptional regulator [Dehalococcoidia bacterium]
MAASFLNAPDDGAAAASLPVDLDPVDRRLLTLLQIRFPLVPEPFRALAEELGIGEAEVLARARRLKGEGVLRQISAIFDSRRLGYTSTLVAVDLPPERLEEG